MAIVSNDLFIAAVRTNYPNCKLSNNLMGHIFWLEGKRLDANAKQLGLVLSIFKGVGGLPKVSTRYELSDVAAKQLFQFALEGMPKPNGVARN